MTKFRVLHSPKEGVWTSEVVDAKTFLEAAKIVTFESELHQEHDFGDGIVCRASYWEGAQPIFVTYGVNWKGT